MKTISLNRDDASGKVKRLAGERDYLISEDGKSVTIYTKAKGSGLLYMEAGYPINDAEMVVLVID